MILVIGSPEPIDRRRRRLLTATTATAALGLAGAAVPFIASMRPTARARAAAAPVEVDVSAIEPGQQITLSWLRRPIWVLHRTPEMIRRLRDPALLERLRDPRSMTRQQPEYARNALRSVRPEFFITVAVCTHLGCVPNYRPEIAPADLGLDWPGGYFCPCHGSRYDLAGRVYRFQPAPLNLEVPPHRWLGDHLLQIGADPE